MSGAEGLDGTLALPGQCSFAGESTPSQLHRLFGRSFGLRRLEACGCERKPLRNLDFDG